MYRMGKVVLMIKGRLRRRMGKRMSGLMLGRWQVSPAIRSVTAQEDHEGYFPHRL